MDGLAYYPMRNMGGLAGGAGATLSYYENMALLFPGSTTIANSVSTIHVLPFILPEAISASILRVPVSISAVSTTATLVVNETLWTVDRFYTDFAVVYSQGTGASSLSLQSVAAGSGLFTLRHQGSHAAGANSTQYTVSQLVSFPASNFGGSSFTTSYAATNLSVNLSTESLTAFTGPRFIDIPFATSLAAGNYWMGFGMSTATAQTSNNAALAGASFGFSTVGVSQSNISWGYPGVATNNSIQVQPGLGIFTTDSAIMSTASIGLGQISAVVSNPKMYFQMIRRA